MDAVGAQLWQFIQTYGIELTILAMVTILFVGVVKLIFKKGFTDMNQQGKKAIYEGLSLVMSGLIVTFWLWARTAIFGLAGDPFSWEVAGKSAIIVWGIVKIFYPLYENLGLRALIKAFGNFIIDFAKNRQKITKKDDNDKGNNGPTVII